MELLNKLPNSVRWVFFLPISIVAFALTLMITNLIGKIFIFLSGPGIIGDNFIYYIMAPYCAGCSAVHVGSNFAPGHRRNAALSIAFILVSATGVITYFSFASSSFSLLLIVAATITGVISSLPDEDRDERVFLI